MSYASHLMRGTASGPAESSPNRLRMKMGVIKAHELRLTPHPVKLFHALGPRVSTPGHGAGSHTVLFEGHQKILVG